MSIGEGGAHRDVTEWEWAPLRRCAASRAPARTPPRATAPTARNAMRITGPHGWEWTPHHIRLFHPVRVRRVTAHRVRCTRCAPLDQVRRRVPPSPAGGKATLVQPRVPCDLRCFPLTSSATSSQEGRFKPPMNGGGGETSPSRRTAHRDRPWGGAWRDGAPHRRIAVRSTGWKCAPPFPPDGQWRPLGALHRVGECVPSCATQRTVRAPVRTRAPPPGPLRRAWRAVSPTSASTVRAWDRTRHRRPLRRHVGSSRRSGPARRSAKRSSGRRRRGRRRAVRNRP